MALWKPPASLNAQPSDITIVVDGCNFCCHKNVLIQNCDYFKAMFSSKMLENWQSEIDIKIVGKAPFLLLISGFYAGQLDLSEENVFIVSAACHVLQVTPPLFTQCCDFLKGLINHDRCFEVMNFTAFHPIQEVYNSARRYCLHHFLTLCKVQSFLNLSLSDVTNYLSDEHLVADGAWEILEALKNWCSFNELSDLKTVKEITSACLHDKVSVDECDRIASTVVNGGSFYSKKWAYLGSRRQKKDTFMFWACLSETNTKGLVDVIRLGDLEECQKLLRGSRYDTMTTLVEDPGFDLGSAVCVKGPYVYICGGGPSFGRMNWIRDIWRFSSFEDKNRWSRIGKLPETRRYHAMVAVNSKLYVFGGFGKFRSKNCCLESFDVGCGLWETQLSPMPEHEFKPTATSHHQCIYYITQQWKVYEYSISSDQWSSCQELDSFEKFKYPHNGGDLRTPVALHINNAKIGSFEKKSSINFTILSYIVGKSFQIVSSPFEQNARTCTVQELDHMKYFGSCCFNEKVFIFLKSRNGDELDNEDENSEDRKDDEVNVLCFEPETGHVNELTTITNVSRSSSIVPISHIPKSFHISHHDHTGFSHSKT